MTSFSSFIGWWELAGALAVIVAILQSGSFVGIDFPSGRPEMPRPMSVGLGVLAAILVLQLIAGLILAGR